MNTRSSSSGFTLIELLIASMIFSMVVISVSGLFTQAMSMQRRAQGIQKIDENAMFMLESMSREIRVSIIDAAANGCATSLEMDHPINGRVTYRYDAVTKRIQRSDDRTILQDVTSSDVEFSKFTFCVTGAGPDKLQTRVTMPMTITAAGSTVRNPVSVSLQTTVTSRDITTDYGL